MRIKTVRTALFLMILSVGFAGPACAGSTHVLGAARQTLSSSTDAVNAGYYSATWLSVVDPNLAVGNIKSGVSIFGKVGTLSSGAFPGSGQILCYDDNGDVWPCGTSYTDQNGHTVNANDDGYNDGGASKMSFTNNGDGTITDNKTGLMWRQCSQGQLDDGSCTDGCPGSPTDFSGYGCGNDDGTAANYAWGDAFGEIAAMNAANYAGHSDWRLPNVKEMQSIVDYSQQNPAINGTYFPNTDTNNYYWTSTTYAPYSQLAWIVYFYDGYVGNALKDTTSTVRPVRAGP